MRPVPAGPGVDGESKRMVDPMPTDYREPGANGATGGRLWFTIDVSMLTRRGLLAAAGLAVQRGP